MSWYRMVDVRIHGDARFLNLSPDQPSGRALFKHLLICEENGPLPGVVRVGAAALAEALEWLPERLRERFQELYREGLAEADWRVRLVFLPNGIKYNPPNNPNQVLGWSKHWDALPEGPLKAKIWHRFHGFFLEDAERRKEEEVEESGRKMPHDALLKAFLRAIPRPADDHPGTVTLTVPVTVTATNSEPSTRGRPRLPEPEPEPEQQEREGSGLPSSKTVVTDIPLQSIGPPASGGTTKKKGRSVSGNGFDPRSVPVPAILDTPDFRVALDRRWKERAAKGSKAKLAESQVETQLEQLADLAEKKGLSVALERLKGATANGTQGIVFTQSYDVPTGPDAGFREDPEIVWRLEQAWADHVKAWRRWKREVEGVEPTQTPTLLEADIRGPMRAALLVHDGELLSADQRAEWRKRSKVRAAGVGIFYDPWCTGKHKDNDLTMGGKTYVEHWRPWRATPGKPDPVERFAEIYFAIRDAAAVASGSADRETLHPAQGARESLPVPARGGLLGDGRLPLHDPQPGDAPRVRAASPPA